MSHSIIMMCYELNVTINNQSNTHLNFVLPELRRAAVLLSSKIDDDDDGVSISKTAIDDVALLFPIVRSSFDSILAVHSSHCCTVTLCFSPPP